MAEENLLKVKQYYISNDFFEKGYSTGNSPCACTSKCCYGGVWVDVNERDVVLAEKELIKQFMDETLITNDSMWFEQEIADDHDFPSGKAVGTQVYNDKCVFLDKLGRCSIQVASVESGRHKWALKPLYCILFPVEVSNNVIGFDPMLQGEQQCCTISSVFETPLFVACKDELTYLLGEDGYEMLEKHYASSRTIPVAEKVL
ncbi:MAG: DUF3109 family protein [Bacteroidota bacterium]